MPPPLEPIAPVMETLTPVATPRYGATRVGAFANTKAPVPVSSVTAARRFALLGVARNVLIAAVLPDREDTGYPVQFVSVPLVGVPRAQLESVLLVSVSVPLSVARVPDTGRVTAVAPDVENVMLFAPSVSVIVPLDASVTLPDAVSEEPFVIVSVDEVAGAVIRTLFTLVAEATPIFGVTRVGEVAKTRDPVPVSSLMTPRSSSDVVAANTLSLFAVDARVPLVGKVTDVDPVAVRVTGNPPD
jgi:hypothetical protein